MGLHYYKHQIINYELHSITLIGINDWLSDYKHYKPSIIPLDGLKTAPPNKLWITTTSIMAQKRWAINATLLHQLVFFAGSKSLLTRASMVDSTSRCYRWTTQLRLPPVLPLWNAEPIEIFCFDTYKLIVSSTPPSYTTDWCSPGFTICSTVSVSAMNSQTRMGKF